MTKQEAIFEYCLRVGDSSLIIGHRLSEWCGHGPILEEDIALINIALDFVGRATAILKYAGEVEGKGRTEDDLAYKRNERDFRNLLLTEQPNGDFAKTIVRQFLLDAFGYYFFDELKSSKDATLSGIAEKAIKETSYHLRHSSEWMCRLGDGTEESHDRMQNALNDLWRFTEEMFETGKIDAILLKEGIAVDLNMIKPLWMNKVNEIVGKANLQIPSSSFMRNGSHSGKHSEHLGYLLAEMQHLHRSYPNSKW